MFETWFCRYFEIWRPGAGGDPGFSGEIVFFPKIDCISAVLGVRLRVENVRIGVVGGVFCALSDGRNPEVKK